MGYFEQRRRGVFNDFLTAAEWIAEGRTGTDRPVANNTRLHLYEETPDRLACVGLKLHATDVVKLYGNGDVEFDSGGWRTVTTKDRMSYHRDFMIYSHKGIWYIESRKRAKRVERELRDKFGLPRTWKAADDYWEADANLGYLRPRSEGHGFWQEVAEVIGHREARVIKDAYDRERSERVVHLFFDGIRFNKHGRCLNGIPKAREESLVAEKEALRIRIRSYCTEAVRHLHAGIDLRQTDHYDEITEFDAGYLETILTDGIFPTRLYYDAMAETGYQELGQLMMLGWDQDAATIGGTIQGQLGERLRASGDTVGNALYIFICKRLIPDKEHRGPFSGGTLERLLKKPEVVNG